MATIYNDIIQLRGGKAAYNIEEEKQGEWVSFIPNEQFNNVLRTVLKSVRGNDIDNHKSFWINGTYGTGKSHAVAVIGHLLGDKVEDIRKWVDYEYGNSKFDSIRQAIYQLRESKRLLTVKLYGLSAMTDPCDLALVLQKAVVRTLEAVGIEVSVPTEFESYIKHIKQNAEIWEHFISEYDALSSIVSTREQLIANLRRGDLGTHHRIVDTLREARMDIRLNNENIKQWLIEVQNQLAESGNYNGLLIVWDEFTDVMSSNVGLPVLKELQEVAEKFANEENNSYVFLISHPSALTIIGDQMKQTDGRYHRMKYNMESVSAFKIMSRKFEVVDSELHEQMFKSFYQRNANLLQVFTQTSNDVNATKDDLCSLFPLHPGTANLATHYATVVGSSSRSVFEFLGQNDAIRDFLNDENIFQNRQTITADYLWDYVLKVFQDNVVNYGAVTERFNSYHLQVANAGAAHLAVFKGALLLNAFNNVSAENNNGLVTPSEDNIKALFAGTQYEAEVEEVLTWFNEQGIIQRAPGGLYSVQFSALPSGEIEEKKREMKEVQFKHTYQVANFSDTAKPLVEKKGLQKVIRPFDFKFYSDVENDSQLRSMIKNGRRDTKSSSLFFAFLVSRNTQELFKLRSFAEACAADTTDPGLKYIVYIVCDETFKEDNYERFIEYQANYACASSHGFTDQQTVHRDHAVGMVKEWIERVMRNNALIFIHGEKESLSISMRHLSNIINVSIAPIIFPSGPDACEKLRNKAATTFWKQQNSKEAVRSFLFMESKEEIEGLTAQMRPLKHLIQDCLDDNMKWKAEIPENDQFKNLCDRVNTIIKHADKSVAFNLDEKFRELTRPPYGLYPSYGAMAMMAFALRPWANKIFDMQGKPRDKNALIDDIVLLFKVWDDSKSNSKLNFKFQTPEEGKLCKALVRLFKLNSKDNAYNDVTSLKDARYAITAEFLAKKDCPLWALKYAPSRAFDNLPIVIYINDEMKRLVDDIVEICGKTELRDPSLVKDTLELISKLELDMKNVLNVDEAFTEGFKEFLMQIDLLGLQEEEVDELRTYLKQNLQSSVGYWSEEEVSRKAKDWRLEQSLKKNKEGNPPSVVVAPVPFPQSNSENTPDNNLNEDRNKPTTQPSSVVQLAKKRMQAKDRVRKLHTYDAAMRFLNRLCDEGNEAVLDFLNS